ncbi:hypothetical protein AB0H34_08360 [Saccharopolyspora shandongensis]|uniref:hypothetical protein n=1 Tax=Saccharopolyspora shandongensis TaxID=418495 RepID=UPI0033E51B5E
MWRYERALAAYLKRRFAATPDGLRAYTIAASVLAAHNYGLRTWRRSGADGDVVSAVDHALDLVHRTWGETGETLVVVARTTTPMWQIVQRIESLQTERGRADTE